MFTETETTAPRIEVSERELRVRARTREVPREKQAPKRTSQNAMGKIIFLAL